MNKYLYLFVAAVLPALLSAQEWKTYKDSAYFTVKYPAAWTQTTDEKKRTLLTSPSDGPGDPFAENVNISVTKNENYGTKTKIRDIFPSVTDNLKKNFREFKLETQRYFQWNNTEACEIIYTGYSGTDDHKFRIIQWFCFYKKRLYTVSFTTLDINLTHTTNAKKIMRSIVFR